MSILLVGNKNDLLRPHPLNIHIKTLHNHSGSMWTDGLLAQIWILMQIPKEKSWNRKKFP
jgi:hypothetical protein